MKYTIENITEKDKRRALYLAHKILSDKQIACKYGSVSIVRGDNPELFTYTDMLKVIEVMFKEIEEGWVH